MTTPTRWPPSPRKPAKEVRFGADVVDSLRERGHEVVLVEPWSDLMADAWVIRLTEGKLVGASDSRVDGVALGL